MLRFAGLRSGMDGCLKNDPAHRGYINIRMIMDDKYIEITGAKENNLKNVSIKIPRDKLVVISGVSGSGKSSLAFDTLFAEGQRRFSESLSSFARQFLGRMSKPAVEKIEGIPPAIAIEQKVNSRNPRSTVGTTTEIYDYLRVIFAKIGKTYSPVSGQLVKKDTVQGVIEFVSSLPVPSYVHVLADFGWDRNEYRVEKLIELKETGFTRLYSSGNTVKIDAVLSSMHDFEDGDLKLLVDRFVIDGPLTGQQVVMMSDSIEKAFSYGEGRIAAAYRQERDGSDTIKEFSALYEADGMVFKEPDELLFSFNNPIGACPHCGGYGKVDGIDEKLVIPDITKSIYDGAIACWRGDTMRYFNDELVNNAHYFDFPVHRPYNELTRRQKNLLWTGNEYFTGLDRFFEIVKANRYKVQYKYLLSRYTGKSVCPECQGSRLRKEALYVRIGEGGHSANIAELLSMSIKELISFFDGLSLSEHDYKIAQRALTEVRQRLEYMDKVGLSYLTLSRASNTLSGGESQRINLVSSLGSALVGSLYILDEPSIGLHPRDTDRLIGILKGLRDLGNTVVIVEHDDEIIRSADYLIDMGPGAGRFGGNVVYEGSPLSDGRSLTLDYINGRLKIDYPARELPDSGFIEIKGAVENNLKNVDARFPLNALTVVTGVSGSGKSSLVGGTLYPGMQRIVQQLGMKATSYHELNMPDGAIEAVEYVDQNPIGKSSRSNPVTYLKVYDDIRKLLSEQPYAKINGYGHSHFSFNIDGGRCPECQGEGVIRIPMQFMADVQIVCESCGGKRFKPDILEVKYKGKNVSDILDMSVEEAIAFFSSQPEPAARRIAEKLQPLMDVGLSYVQLGQNSTTLSGGESQRVKLAYFLSKDVKQKRTLFIFDEPTTGLHFSDIQNLMNSFRALLDRGHTIVVVEHNMAVVKCADWIVDLGPEGGEDGGRIVYQGPVSGLKGVKDSCTAKYL